MQTFPLVRGQCLERPKLHWACLLVERAPAALPVAVAVLALHGCFYAATDGVLMAHVAPLLSARGRATGLATVQTCQALARAGGALAFGALAARTGLGPAFTFFAVALALALAAATALRTPWSTT